MPLWAGTPVCQETVAEVEVRLDTATEEIPRTPAGAVAVTVNTMVPVTVGFSTLVAVIVAVPEVGTVAGAVYWPVEEMVPAVALQVTAEL